MSEAKRANYLPVTKVREMRPVSNVGDGINSVMSGIAVNAGDQVAVQKPEMKLLVAENKAAIATMAAMIAGYNMEASLPDHEFMMLVEACRRFEVTKAELETAFWKAYADKFTGKRMYFRHLWTHIQAERERNDVSLRKRFTFAQVCGWLESRNLPLDYAPYFDFHKGEDGEKFYTLKPEMYDGR